MSITIKALSEYQAVWLFALFDLPVKTKKQRQTYTRFRKLLIHEGFCMLQFSIYARYCASEEASAAHRNRVRASVPAEGQVRLLAITDKQFGKMEVFLRGNPTDVEEEPSQIMLF